MLNLRFEKFQETNMFMFYGQYAFEEDVSLERKEEYETMLYNLKSTLKIEYEIEHDYIVTDYIEKYEEPIDEEDIYDFIRFCKIILEKLYEIIAKFKIEKRQTTKQKIKNMEQESKRMERDIKQRERDELKKQEQDARRLLREARDEEDRKEREDKQLLRKQIELKKEEQKQLEQNQKILMKQQKEREAAEKERLAAEKVLYNLEIIECDCGLLCQRQNLINHQKGKDHITRIEAIQWFIKKNGLTLNICK